MNWEYIDQKLYWLLEQTSEIMVIKDYQTIKELVDHGEEGLALEELCSIIFGTNTKISSKTYSTIKELAQQMKINEKYWKDLKVE